MIRYLLAIVIAAIAPYALADAINVTLTGPTSITVPEDGATNTHTYTLANNSGAPIEILTVGFVITFLSGNFTDIPVPVISWGEGIDGATCVPVLVNSASCTLGFAFATDSGSGETDANFGTESVDLEVNLLLPAGGTDRVSITPTVTVTDPGVSGVSEPATLALLGIGLAGLGFSRRRRVN